MSKRAVAGFLAGAVFATAILLLAGCEQRESGPSTEALKSLPYLTWNPMEGDSALSGVITHKADQAYPGLNLYCSRNRAAAYLIDMEGRLVHSWSSPETHPEPWQHIEMTESGDLLAIAKDKGLIMMDWDSNIRWTLKDRFHHDVAVRPDGKIYALARRDRPVFHNRRPVIVLDDYLVLINDGEIEQRISMYDILRCDIAEERSGEILKWMFSLTGIKLIAKTLLVDRYLIKNSTPADLIHTNSIEILDRTIPGCCKPGDILISFGALDMIAVLRPQLGEIAWRWGPGEISKQHHPVLLDSDNILVFDNGVTLKRSRVLELDPVTMDIVWQYAGDPPERFFTLSRGTSQRLPNGNTLITESDMGHVFEITSDGGIVWEFYNSEIQPETNSRAAIYRMVRIAKPDAYPWFDRLR
jgi:hypothetical protein